jgi:hypothetical protein
MCPMPRLAKQPVGDSGVPVTGRGNNIALKGCRRQPNLGYVVDKPRTKAERIDRSSEAEQPRGRVYRPPHMGLDFCQVKPGIGKIPSLGKTHSSIELRKPKIKAPRNRFVSAKLDIPDELVRFKRSRDFKDLKRSLRATNGGRNPFYRFRAALKNLRRCPTHIQDQISSALEGGLIMTDKYFPGIRITNRILMVKKPSWWDTEILLSKLPYWATSYTTPVIHKIVSLVKKRGAGGLSAQQCA